MRKMFVRMVAFLSAIAGLCNFLGACSCSGYVGPPELSTEYFRYKVQKKGGKVYIDISGLTEEGAKQKVLTVPKEIGGINVDGLYDEFPYGSPNFMARGGGWWKSNMLEKVFLDRKYIAVENVFGDCTKLKVVCIINFELEDVYKGGGVSSLSRSRGSFISQKVYYSESKPHECLAPANITYYYNFDNSKNNGVYWIDNENYGSEIEYKPKDPIREGYKFGGWYKEADCINEWAFGIDKTPDEQKDAEEKVIYQETKLFAKWNKK